MSEEAEDLRLKAAIDVLDAIRVGDVVKLKSGGPELTVDTVRDDRVVDVVWFMGSYLQRDAFPISMLRKELMPDALAKRNELAMGVARLLLNRAKATGRTHSEVYRESVFFDPMADA